MAIKTIVTETVTLHVVGNNYKPVRLTPEGKNVPNSGKYDIIEVKPGTPVELDEVEANSFIARGVAKEYVVTIVEAPKVVAAAAVDANKPAK